MKPAVTDRRLPALSAYSAPVLGSWLTLSSFLSAELCHCFSDMFLKGLIDKTNMQSDQKVLKEGPAWWH